MAGCIISIRPTFHALVHLLTYVLTCLTVGSLAFGTGHWRKYRISNSGCASSIFFDFLTYSAIIILIHIMIDSLTLFIPDSKLTSFRNPFQFSLLLFTDLPP